MRCVILDDYQGVALGFGDWGRLAGRVDVAVERTWLPDAEAVTARLAGAQIVVAMRERTAFDAAQLALLPDLRLLVTTGMRNAAIDLAAARAQGITVCGTRGSAGATAELAWGLLLSLMRHIPAEAAGMRAGGWQTTVGRELRGRVLGVVGLGKLGTLVAGYGRAFGMEVVGWTRTDCAARCAALGIGAAAGLDDLLERAEAVSLHVTLTPQTRGMIGAAQLGRMRPGSVLVNTSRGPLVDEAGLIAALRDGPLAGAAVDVYGQEPLPADHPFRSLPNLICTPHLGYVTEETYRAFFSDAVEDIEAWLAGAPVRVVE